MMTAEELVDALWNPTHQSERDPKQRVTEVVAALKHERAGLQRLAGALAIMGESLSSAPHAAAAGDNKLVTELTERVKTEGWLSEIKDLQRYIRTTRTKAQIPVTAALMGRMGVGKSTVLKHLLATTSDDPPRHIPARPEETTACAVRWVDAHAESRDDVTRGSVRLALSAQPETDKPAEYTVHMDGVMDDETPYPWAGLEVTAHPPRDGFAYWLQASGGTWIVRRGPKLDDDIPLEWIAAHSRQATIATPSYRMKDGDSFLRLLDILDMPGADAPDGNRGVREKAELVFEQNVHECSMLLLVSGATAAETNVGKQVWHNWTRWALRCVLEAPKEYRELLVAHLLNAYDGRFEELAAVIGAADQHDMDLAEQLSTILNGQLADSDRFWEWLDSRKRIANATDFEDFTTVLRRILQTTKEFSAASLEDGRVLFVVNYAKTLLAKTQFNHNRPQDTFPAGFCGNTLAPLQQSIDLLASDWWPRFVLVDIPGKLDPPDYIGDPRTAFAALMRLYHPEHPVPLTPEWHTPFATWLRERRKQRLDASELTELLSGINARHADALRFVAKSITLARVHDFAQGWWWDPTFCGLTDSRRREIYAWSLAVALALVDRDSHNGFGALRAILRRQATQRPLERHLTEVRERAARAMVRVRALWDELRAVDVAGKAELKQLEAVRAEVRAWPRDALRGLLRINARVAGAIELHRGKPVAEYARHLRAAAVEGGLAQLAESAGPENKHSAELVRVVTFLINRDPVIAAIENTQFAHGTLRDEVAREVARAVLFRVGVVLHWLRGRDALGIALDALSDTEGDLLLPKIKRAVLEELSKRSLGTDDQWHHFMGKLA